MNPIAEYQQRLAARRAEVERQNRTHIRFGNIRLLLGLGAALIAYAAFITHALNPIWLLAPVVGFVPLAILHDRVLRRRALAERAAQFSERGIARIEDTWHGTGETGERFRDDMHPYSGDLDLFGGSSLFQLLSQARTRAGEELLAEWLLAPADAGTIRNRQASIAELRGYLDLRESLFVLGEEARDTVHTDHLTGWAESTPVLPADRKRTMAIVLSVSLAASAAVAKLTGNTLPLTVVAAAVASFGFWLRPRVLAVLSRVDEAVHDLGLLAALLERIETHDFTANHLRELQGALRKTQASRAIAALHTLAHYIDNRHNPAMRVVGPPLLYGTHLAFAVEAWRAKHGPHIRQWLHALSEIEALLSLAAYSYEHPEDPFPELLAEVMIGGEELGHPLIPRTRCVRNRVHLDAEHPLIIVSGSNMSGKSTYLRAIGINVVMAMAGAPVRAKSLRLCPLHTGAAIRVTDSLQGGSSRFFAEITRLRKIVDLTSGAVPALFLLDELLNGTNSHDRAIGAEGIIRELLTRHAIGLVTTHDLALTAIADKLGKLATNAHFEDTLEGGKLHFDYTLRPGVVEKSNALELMRSIGLDV